VNAAALEWIPAPLFSGQPNEVDLRRIVRAIEHRKRYRYVTPTVRPVREGYHIQSPCCSRRVDPDGGVVDVALLRFVPGLHEPWHLYRKDHIASRWELFASYGRLDELLAHLNSDPHRLFWQ
jgi:hypothetical protein